MKDKINYYLLQSKTVNILFFLMLASLPFVNKFSKFTVVLFLISFFKFIYEYKDFILPRTHKIFLSLFFTLIFISNLLAGTMLENFKKDMYLAIFILIYIAVNYFMQKKILKISTIIYALVIPISLYMIDGLYQYYNGFDFLFHNALRGGINSVSRNRNIFAFVIFFYFTALFFLSFEYKSNQNKFIIYLLLFLSFLTLFLTLCRQMWISVFLFMAIVIFFKYKLFSIKSMLFIVVVSIGLVSIYYLFPDIQHRLVDLENMKSSGRVELWKVLLPAVWDAPIFGHSMQEHINVLVDGKSYIYDNGKHFLYAHNLTIGILYDFGLVGIILYFTFLGYFLKKLFTCKDKIVKPYFLAIFLAIMFVQQQLGGSMLIHKLIGPFIMIFLALVMFYCGKESFVKQSEKEEI